MSKSGDLILQSLEIVKENRQKQLLIAESKKSVLYAKYPKLSEFDNKIASVFKNAMKSMVSGGEADLLSAEKESLALQKEKAEYINKNNIDISVIEPVFFCKNCEDTGYFNGKICGCVKQRAIKLNYEELNKDVLLKDYTFKKFNLDLYSKNNINGIVPKEVMTKIYNFSVDYANEFSKDSESILFFGKTGLGKTHLSLAIANEVIKNGYNVVYGPISKLIGKIEKEHFGNQERSTLNNVLECDLLVFDDLGTEFASAFNTSVIFEIINSRILNKRPTIINTNLDFNEIKQKYTDRVVSRIVGNYRMLHFLGDDIRTIR